MLTLADATTFHQIFFALFASVISACCAVLLLANKNLLLSQTGICLADKILNGVLALLHLSGYNQFMYLCLVCNIFVEITCMLCVGVLGCIVIELSLFSPIFIAAGHRNS